MASDKLTLKQERFVAEYLKHGDASKAYRAAYSTKNMKPESVHRLAHAVKQNVKVASRLTAAQERIAERAIVTVEQIVRELAYLGLANMQDYVSIGPDGSPHPCFAELTREQFAAIQEVTVEEFKDGKGDDARDVRRIKFKLADKRAALVDLGRHLGAFKADQAPTNVAVQVNVGLQQEDAQRAYHDFIVSADARLPKP